MLIRVILAVNDFILSAGFSEKSLGRKQALRLKWQAELRAGRGRRAEPDAAPGYPNGRVQTFRYCFFADFHLSVYFNFF